MKLIGQELGRIIVLFPIEEVRPASGIPLIPLVDGIRNRYNFVKPPDLNRPITDLDRDGYSFQVGTFLHEGQVITIREFTVYPDGVSVSCLDTTHADAFFDDIVNVAKEAFGFREFAREPRKIYRSQVIVEFEKSLNQLINGFTELSRLLQSAYEQHTGHNKAVDLNRVDFRMDSTKIPGIPPVSFILERKFGSPHENQRFISEAPVPSQAHLQLLQEIENKLS